MKHFFLFLALASDQALKLLQWWLDLPGLPLGGDGFKQLGVLVATGILIDQIWDRARPADRSKALWRFLLQWRGDRKALWIEAPSYVGVDRRSRTVDRRGSRLGGRRCTDSRGAAAVVGEPS